MLLDRLAKSWEVDPHNENHPGAFGNYRLKDLNTIHRLVSESRAPVALFKPILNTCQTPSLLSHFPESRAVFLFRHPEDVVNSSFKKFGASNRINHVRAWIADDFAEFSFSPPPEITRQAVRSHWDPSLSPESGAALYWLFYNRLYFDLGLADDERVGLVQYESLVQRPRREFERITGHLGIHFEETMIEGIFASSVRRDAPPPISEAVRADCEVLWQRLSGQAELQFATFTTSHPSPP